MYFNFGYANLLLNALTQSTNIVSSCLFILLFVCFCVVLRNMRASILSTACEVGVPDAVARAKQKFTSWMDHGTAFVLLVGVKL